MKKGPATYLFAFLLTAMVFLPGVGWGQVTLFTESMGTVVGTTAIATHEANNGFDNDDLTFSGTAELRATTVSTGYTGASGGANVFITNTIGRYLIIEGINTLGYTDLTLSLGHYKSTIAGNNELAIEISSDGIDWAFLTYSRPTGTGTANWLLITPSGTIPSVENLRIRFTQTSTEPQFRIDDIKLVGTPLTPVLNVNPASLSGFSYFEGFGPSAEQSFTVSGSNLTDDITITPPTNFEISTGTGVSFSLTNPIVLAESDGNVAETTIYVRLKAGLTIGNYEDEKIIARSVEAIDRVVNCSGIVTDYCGLETFDNLSISGTSYSDGDFTGNDGVQWYYYQSRSEGSYPIDGKGIMLHNAYESKLETEKISGGIRSFSLQMRKAFENQNPRQLELYVNGEKVGESIVFGNAFFGEDPKIHNFEINEINIPGDFSLLIKNVGSTLTDRQTVIDNISWTCYIEPICPTTFQYYRSKRSGNWEDSSTWEASENEINWVDALCVPDYRANRIIIRDGHTVTINKFLRTNQTTIESGGTLIRASGNNRLIIHDDDGTDDGLIVHGVFRHAASLPPPEYQGTIRVETGGMIEVTNNISHPASHYGTSDKIFYENGAIFYWNVTSNALFSTADETYFVNSGPDQIPIFRVNTPNIFVGGGLTNPTTINGVFEVTQNTVTWQYDGTKTFRNGIIGSGTVVQRADVNISGKFVISGTKAILGGSGSLNLNSNGLEISEQVELISDKTITGGPVTLSGALYGNSNSLNLGGHFTVTPSGSFPDARTNLVLNGSANQNLSLADGKVLNYLQINKSGGYLNLLTPITVSQILTMNQGNILTNGYLVTLGTSATQTGTLNHTEGIIFGPMQRWFPPEPNTGYLSGLFPIGHPDVGMQYLPALVEYTDKEIGGPLTAEFIATEMGTVPEILIPAAGSCPAFTVTLSSEQGFWRFTDNHAGPDGIYDITLYSNYFEFLERDLCKLTSLRRSNSIWEVPSGSTHIAPGGSTEFPVIKRIGNVGFSDWGVAGAFESPLPIELLSFTAKYQDGIVLLKWATGSEINNDFFNLERSRDALNAEIIGFVEGAGNSSHTLNYEFVDHDPLPGILYYRLKQTDFDGSFEYSQWVAVQVDGIGGRLQALAISQPQGLMLRIYTPTGHPLQVQLADIYGRIVHSQELSPGSPGHIETFVPMPQTARSVLLYRITDGLDVVTGKVVR